MSSKPPSLSYIDVGINFTDPVFRGLYHGKRRHEDDLDDVVQRAVDAGCKKFMVTGSDLAESRAAVELAMRYPSLCYATIGVHPCSAQQFDTHSTGPIGLLTSLEQLAFSTKASGHAVAFGEIGLDYDRLFLTPKEQQLKYFAAQLDVAVRVQLPLFLHSRAAAEDFERLLGERLGELLLGREKKGLVHSFTGTREEMERLVAMGFDIGVNGCSMKTEENITVVRAIPLSHLHLETDGPWCEMRPSHASGQYFDDGAPPLLPSVKKEKFVKGSMVKGRNEPATINRVAYAVAKIKGVPVEEVCEAAWRNSVRMFGFDEQVSG